jgi:hypothetical protein
MIKLSGLIFASALLCAGGAQALQLNAHTPPTIHALNPQPLPPGIYRQPTTSITRPTGKAPMLKTDGKPVTQ